MLGSCGRLKPLRGLEQVLSGGHSPGDTCEQQEGRYCTRGRDSEIRALPFPWRKKGTIEEESPDVDFLVSTDRFGERWAAAQLRSGSDGQMGRCCSTQQGKQARRRPRDGLQK